MRYSTSTLLLGVMLASVALLLAKTAVDWYGASLPSPETSGSFTVPASH